MVCSVMHFWGWVGFRTDFERKIRRQRRFFGVEKRGICSRDASSVSDPQFLDPVRGFWAQNCPNEKRTIFGPKNLPPDRNLKKMKALGQVFLSVFGSRV